MIVTTVSKCLIQTTDIVTASGSTSGGGTFNTGDPVTLVAAVKSGFVFVNWTVGGSEVSTNSTYNFNAPASDTTYTANFSVQVVETTTTGNLGFNLNYLVPQETVEISDYQGIISTSGNLGLNINYNLDATFDASAYQGIKNTSGNLGFVIESNLDLWQATMPKLITRTPFINPVPGYVQIFNKNKMFNSFDYSPNRRNAFGSFKFTTDAALIYIRVSNNFAAYQNLSLFVDDAFNQAITVTSSIEYKSLTLPGGSKTIEIVEGITTHDQGLQIITGTDILEIYVPANSITNVLEEGTVTKKFVFLTDSVGVGAGATNPIVQSFVRLLKLTYGLEVATIGAGWDSLKNHASGTSTLIATTIARLNFLFRNTVDKRIVITLSSNDVAILSESATNVNTNMNSLLDAIHTNDINTKIYVVGPFTRDGFEPTLATVRTNFNTICTERSGYCTYINGPTISPNYPSNYPDYTHPNTTEHALIASNIYTYF